MSSSAAGPGRSDAGPVAVRGGMYRVVDLSLLLAEAYPGHWPTHLPFQRKTGGGSRSSRRRSGGAHGHLGPYTTRWLLMDEHTGDALRRTPPLPAATGLRPAPRAPLGAVTAEQVPLSQLMGRARVMDVRDLVGTTRGRQPGGHPRATAGLGGRVGRPGRATCFCSAAIGTALPSRPRRRGYCHDVIVTQAGDRAGRRPAPSSRARSRSAACAASAPTPPASAPPRRPASARRGPVRRARLPRVPCATWGRFPGGRRPLRVRALKLDGRQRGPGPRVRLVPDDGVRHGSRGSRPPPRPRGAWTVDGEPRLPDPLTTPDALYAASTEPSVGHC